MIQNILAISTVCLIIGIVLYKSIRKSKRKKNECGCGGCGNLPKIGSNRKAG